jgi:hypothetical protein
MRMGGAWRAELVRRVSIVTLMLFGSKSARPDSSFLKALA